MIDEIKRYTTMYDQKLNFAVTETEITALLTDTELIIENCNQKLEDAGMSPCCYTPLDEKIARLQRDLDILKRYVQTTREYIYSKLDQPFQQNFSCNATETLSQIKISELETDNNIALQEYCEIYRQGYTHGYKKVKAKLKFSDFLTIEEVRPGDGTVVLEGMDTIQEFAVLFRPQYNKLMEDVQDISDCAEIILTQGEYNHAEYHPVGNLISSLLDITIVKPIVECFVGRDLITGEELEESQKAVKLAGAAVGLVTLGQSVLVAKGTGMAGKELLGVVGKTVLLDMASMAATYGMGYAGEQLGLPGEVTWILSVATGCTVSMVGGKLLFRDIDRGIIQECTTEDLAKITGEKSGALDMTQVGKSVTAEEIDIYLQYKKEGSLYRFSREEREAIQRMQRMDIPDEEFERVLQVRRNTKGERGSDTVAYHSVGGDNSAKKIQSVLDGIDISYTNPESRFGQGFYVAADGNTTVAELAYHGTDAKYSIRYDMNLEGQKVLDLTAPKVASEWGFLQGESSLLECQNIAEIALDEGYNVIKVQSYRDAGINYVIYGNFDEILQPQMVTPIGD